MERGFVEDKVRQVRAPSNDKDRKKNEEEADEGRVE